MSKKIKKTAKKKMTIAGVAYTLLFAAAAGQITGSDTNKKCGGTELWYQKVLLDTGVSHINTHPVSTTIADLNAIVTDTESRTKTDPRLSFERSVVKVHDVLIRKVLRESDNDYHLVIQDAAGHHMIAEIPDPNCPDAQQSNFTDDFAQARNTMDRYGTKFQHYEFDITGVPFRDRAHGQTGRAENNLEIHPVLHLRAVKKLPF